MALFLPLAMTTEFDHISRLEVNGAVFLYFNPLACLQNDHFRLCTYNLQYVKYQHIQQDITKYLQCFPQTLTSFVETSAPVDVEPQIQNC